jgi:hypothetical protein
MDQKRIGHDVTQETETGHDRRERPWLRHDIYEFHFEQVARNGAFDVHRASQRVDASEGYRGEVGHR